MSLAYLAFSERQPALYAVLFSARRELAIALWSNPHCFASLRAARPKLDWSSAEDYVRRTLAAHVRRYAK